MVVTIPRKASYEGKRPVLPVRVYPCKNPCRVCSDSISMTLPPLLAVSGSHCMFRVVLSKTASSLLDLSSSGEKILKVLGCTAIEVSASSLLAHLGATQGGTHVLFHDCLEKLSDRLHRTALIVLLSSNVLPFGHIEGLMVIVRQFELSNSFLDVLWEDSSDVWMEDLGFVGTEELPRLVRVEPVFELLELLGISLTLR